MLVYIAMKSRFIIVLDDTFIPNVHKTKSRHEISTLGARGFFLNESRRGSVQRFISLLIFIERALWSQDNLIATITAY